MALVVNVIDGEPRQVVEVFYKNNEVVANRFPFGDVYVRNKEAQGVQWRLLVRGSRADDITNYFSTLMPVNVENLPPCVKLVHACTE